MTPFHAYFLARELDALAEREKLLPVFAASDIVAYPFQIAAAHFALRSPWQKGVILCDEAGLGKSHEALLILAQRYLEGAAHLLLCIPNMDLLPQWIALLDRHYTLPYTVLRERRDLECTDGNAFDRSGLVITTYDFAAAHEADAAAIAWDLVAFEEANALSGVYREDSKLPRALYRVAGTAFKLLLTGTPIEKNIFDLYGLIWFIDNSVLPDEREYQARYLRKPENYPELAARVSKYCFRTLRSQARGYAKLPERVLLTLEYSPTPEESALYRLLYAYVNRPEKLAFPEMDAYDLALRLLGLQSSSTAAIRQTVSGVVQRLEKLPGAAEEIEALRAILAACDAIGVDTKARLLMETLKRGFALMKQRGAARKAVIFTESTATQNMLSSVVSAKYKTVCYHGGADASAIQQFIAEAEVLISTDHGARGFHLAAASFVIHYDLLYNTLKMEQRIDRCHRLGQQNDVLSVAFINKENFADVRKLELVSKRRLVSDGVFGVSDAVIGGFADALDAGFAAAAKRLRPARQVEADHQGILTARAPENRQAVATAEELLFTTFTGELADKVRLSPQYVQQRAAELNATLWELVKYFFQRWNEAHGDSRFVIDEAEKTVTAADAEKRPVLFYYWDGSRNRPYRSQKQYGMARDFQPGTGRVTLTSIIGRGILHELACAESGTLQVQGDIEACRIGLYHVIILSEKRRITERSVLVGQTDAGRPLSEEQCRELLRLPVVSYAEEGANHPQWLKCAGRHDPLDDLVPIQALLAEQAQTLSPALAEEAARLRQAAQQKKSEQAKGLTALEAQLASLERERGIVTGDRLQRLALDKRINQLRREVLQRQEKQFFDALRVDVELEEQLQTLAAREKLTAKVMREFIISVERNT
ncbi:MAG: DEAD/DEAH box helicase [Acidaminococcaceae bacterium]|nr:DEAD/DEAH box helicase [Acidaminococcaceae bacterium]